MEAPVNAGNAGAAEWLDDGGRPRRMFWKASAHIITAVIGSGVISLAWAIAQLGWIAGPAAMLLFAFVTYYTATLLAECYRTGDPDMAKRNYTYMDAVRSNLGGAKVTFFGVIQYANLVGVAIGYTIASSISMRAIRRAGCFHDNGHADPCNSSSTPYMILFGAVQILFSQIPDFDQIWWLSIVAAVMSFTYSSIGLSLGIAQTISNGGFKGSLTGMSFTYSAIGLFLGIAQTISNGGFMGSTLTGVSIGAGINSTQKICPLSSWVLIQAISFMLSSVCLALAEYMRIWVKLPPACRIGRRAPMPTTGAVKGSGMHIGRPAQEAGCSYVIPTTRAEDRSLLPCNVWDWSGFMNFAIINTDESCVISAAVMCMEALYKIDVIANSYCFKVRDNAIKSLKDMCKERKVWTPYVGAPTVEGVLEVIRSWVNGIPTVHDNISLRLKSYMSFKAGELNPLVVTSMLQSKGPVIGVLYVDKAYFGSTVYRGDRAFPANHAVVCTGYSYIDGELFIIIMDNVEAVGPIRLVLHKAFREFHVLTVDAS